MNALAKPMLVRRLVSCTPVGLPVQLSAAARRGAAARLTVWPLSAFVARNHSGMVTNGVRDA